MVEPARPIYLDYNATTPVDAAVVAAMLPYLTEHFGNPSSAHAYGHAARAAVESARAQVAGLLGAAADEVIFTGCGTESNNLAIRGVALSGGRRTGHIVTTGIEHPAVLHTCRHLEREYGFRVTYLPVDGHGRLDPDAVRTAIAPDTVLVTIMLANNEVGTLQPVAEVAAICCDRGIPCHTDAAQAVGKVPVRVDELGVDLLTVAGHKLYAPKGVGALYVRRGTRLAPVLHGAGHEGGLRPGTENVPYAVALGAACALAARLLPEEGPRLRALRDRLHTALAARLPDLRLNGHPEHRLPNTLNVSIPGLAGYDLLAAVPQVAASTGAACHSGEARPSAVLLAMGTPPDLALGTLRLTVGRYTTPEELDQAADLLARGARTLRG